ncbi:Arylacetamide deacetylase [Hondaea fermentalgiana]|uniref:Arylacetamide deacetylase n=1 Tax=Hondaea fermentalgiana TaxID=2315210 RepID=A0A2R5GTP5_9STRA|nr:Arylacetamide deacetylase [Hondaea fermentalgiana]|eukprot:GBG33945.1 Arylacetamide deacetylase [Hondaea fermentalgiana]
MSLRHESNPEVDERLLKALDVLMENPKVHPGYKKDTMRLPVFGANLLLSYNHDETTYKELVKSRLERDVPKFMAIVAKEKPIDLPEEVKAMAKEDDLEISTDKITSEPDGNTVPICVIKPKDRSEFGEGPLPCVMYIHGGGMAFNSIYNPEYFTLCKVLARQGVVVVMAEYRNTTVPTEHQSETAPFPAGLNDCYSALKWIHASKESLGIDERIVVSGDSGGGNLTLTIALKAIRDGERYLVQHGIYPLCPYIAGQWPQDVQDNGILGTSHLNSECNQVFLNLPDNEVAAIEYSIDAFRKKDPLSWAAFATDEDIKQFPRTTIQVSELDPLRDEGILFSRRLMEAGVRATCKVLIGAVHASTAMGCSGSVPEMTMDTLISVAGFARSRAFLC